MNKVSTKKYHNFPVSQFLIAVFIVTVSFLLSVHVSFAQTASLNTDTAFGGATGQTAESLAGQAGLGTTDFRLVVARIINIALGFLGIIAVGLIIYAGFLWMTAAGNETQIALAKKIMTGAAIGLVIILAAFGIAAFVLRVLLGATGGGGGGEACTTVDETRACGCGGTQTCGSDNVWGACIGRDCGGLPTTFNVTK
ncbi:MAG: pilin, partial [Patescibacteria group bacterium]